MKVKIKKLHPDAVIPSYAKSGDAGMDLTAVKSMFDIPNGVITYHTGLSIEIPEGCVGLIFPRSSIFKYDLTLTNCVGVIDSGYRGEIMLKFKRTGNYNYNPTTYNRGDRVGQIIIVPYPKIEFVESEELSTSERGEGGYGSSGK